MKIKRLKLSGFKSFVDPTELRIDTGLTGIVGPNGCGKSNLLEAIRWVMGETSARSLRGAGMEDVIFAGNGQRPRRDIAEVSLTTVQDQDNRIAGLHVGVDGEVEVTRRIERGSGSSYRANGNDVRAKDITLLFADAATGPHSPALVSQGKIAAVVAARPQERRAMLEEAAGIAGLHVRRKDAEQRLRAAETNLTRLNEIVGDMESRAATLRRQAHAAERYIRLSDLIELAEARTIYARWHEANVAAEAARAEAQMVENSVKIAQESHTHADATTKKAFLEADQCRTAAHLVREKSNDARHQLSNLQSELSSIERHIDDLDQQTARLEEDKLREERLGLDASEALARLKNEVAQLSQRIADAERQIPTLDAQIARAETASRQAENTLNALVEQNAHEQADLRLTETTLAAAQSRYDIANREYLRISSDRSNLPDSSLLTARLEEANSAQEQAIVQRASAEAMIEAAEVARTTAERDRSNAESALSSARANLAALTSEETALSRAINSSKRNQSRALDHLKVKTGYERALAAALGDDLEASVGAGVTQGWIGAAQLADDPALPLNASPLSDHVQGPTELSRRLSQIMVVEKDEGQTLSVGQRLVTLEGRLRRWDGYIAENRGVAAAENLIYQNRLETLTTEIPEAASAVSDAQKALDHSKQEQHRANDAVLHGRTLFSQAEQQLRSAMRSIDETTTALERLAGKRDAIEDRLSHLEEHRNIALQDVEAAQQQRKLAPDGSKTSALIAIHRQSAEQARNSLVQLQTERTNAARILSDDRHHLITAETDAKSWQERINETDSRLALLTERAKVIVEERASAATKPESLKNSILTLTEECSQLAKAEENALHAESAAESAVKRAESMAHHANERLSTAREARARAMARAEAADDKRAEASRMTGERFNCPPPLLPEKLGFNVSSIRRVQAELTDQEKLFSERTNMGPVNLVAAQELQTLESELTASRQDNLELTQSIHHLRGSIGSLNREGRQRLLAAFEAVDAHFRRLFTILFNGGRAHLAFVDSDDPLEAGLEIMVEPPGKKLASLTLLSGGEQALTAIALIFGLFLTNPAPICVLDEVDAPLDDANVERFCDLLDVMVAQTDTRYLIVTHNAVTMARMHRLFGVTMVEQGISRLVSVNLRSAEELLADA